jgi:Na+-transporting NADH:ubiquinone oxidoreductase subunit NqrD
LSAVTGNQPNRTPKMSWAKLPITKTGIEMTSSVLTVTRLSANFPRLIPASIPAEIPITISTMIAITASLIVVGKRIASSWATEFP